MQHISNEDNFRQALKLHQRGDLVEAKLRYISILNIEPDHTDALHLLGLIEFQLKNHAEAERLIRAAINIRNDIPDYYFNYGLLLSDQYRFDEAEQALRSAIQLRPRDTTAIFALGNVLYELSKFAEAEQTYLSAKSLAPYDCQIHLGLANSLIAQNHLDKAKTVLERVLSLSPDYSEALGNMGVILRKQGHLDAAENYLRQAIDANPASVEALNNLGSVLFDAGNLEDAEAMLRKAIALKPTYASAYNNLGNLLITKRYIEEADAAYTQAINISPEYADARWNRSLVQLLRGDFISGWREYEWRLKRPDIQQLHTSFSSPQWQGQSLNGKIILLNAEQGLGDTLQFVRFAPLVAATGGLVILRCQSPLKNLLQKTLGIASVITESDPLPQFDFYCPLLSLPFIFAIHDINKIPASTPYLSIDPSLVQLWANKVVPSDNLKVGLVWAGASRKDDLTSHLIDRRRSIPLSQFAPLFEIQGVDFYSLQKGEPSAEAIEYNTKIINIMDEVNDFSETAALIAHLDLVISVDTSVAHLTGALAKPVWLLSRFDGCWRWMLDRDDSPWYPTMRLFHQHRPLDWTPSINAIRSSLQDLAIAHISGRLANS